MTHYKYAGTTVEHIPRCTLAKTTHGCTCWCWVWTWMIVWYSQCNERRRLYLQSGFTWEHIPRCAWAKCVESAHTWWQWLLCTCNLNSMMWMHYTTMKLLYSGFQCMHIPRCAQVKNAMSGQTTFSAYVTFTSGVPTRPFAAVLQRAVHPPIFSSLAQFDPSHFCSSRLSPLSADTRHFLWGPVAHSLKSYLEKPRVLSVEGNVFLHLVFFVCESAPTLLVAMSFMWIVIVFKTYLASIFCSSSSLCFEEAPTEVCKTTLFVSKNWKSGATVSFHWKFTIWHSEY